MRGQRILLLAGVAVVTGCYRYVPARIETVEPGQAIRVRLSAAEAERLEPVRQTDLRLMEGVVVRNGSDELLVDTRIGSLDPRSGMRALTQRINVPIGGIQEVEYRRMDGLRTGAAIGVVAVAVGVGVAAAFGAGRGGPRDDPEPIPEMIGRRSFGPRWQVSIPF
jgi:hypothetical protein